MGMKDSGLVRNHVKGRSLLIAIAVHIFLALSTFGITLVVGAITALIANGVCNREIRAADADSNTFKKGHPFRSFGQAFGDFQHVFFHQVPVVEDICTAIAHAIAVRMPVDASRRVKIKDVDKDLREYEEREFLVASIGETDRGTSITLILEWATSGCMQSIRWWTMVGGYVDRDKKFNFVAYSLFTLPFWIIPYLKNDYEPLSGIRTIYSAAFNDIDIATSVRFINDAVFDTMVDELDKREIDTTHLKAQSLQVMNIQISGGKVNMGNVVQGAMNKVLATAKAKS